MNNSSNPREETKSKTFTFNYLFSSLDDKKCNCVDPYIIHKGTPESGGYVGTLNNKRFGGGKKKKNKKLKGKQERLRH